MIFFKICGAGFVLISCTLAGFYMSYKLKLRINFLNDFIEFLTRLKTNMRYYNSDIFEIIDMSLPDSISIYFNSDNKSLSSYWQNSIDNIPDSFSLTEEDYNNLGEFGRTLGTTDLDGQLNHIKAYKEIFKTTINNCRDEYKTKLRLYRTLGFFAGAILALLII